jgi:hypothetical protein
MSAGNGLAVLLAPEPLGKFFQTFDAPDLVAILAFPIGNRVVDRFEFDIVAPCFGEAEGVVQSRIVIVEVAAFICRERQQISDGDAELVRQFLERFVERIDEALEIRRLVTRRLVSTRLLSGDALGCGLAAVAVS